MKNFKNNLSRLIIALFLLLSSASSLFASSHREAPMISNDPLADNCDVYAFRSPNNMNKVTLIATYVPMQFPHGGPNYYSFGENIRYEIHVDNNVSTAGDDITYRFTFNKSNGDPTTFFNIRLGAENLKTTYTLEKSTNGGSTWTTIITNGVVPPPNIGARSIETGVGLNTSYNTLFNNAITNASSGEKVFCGTSDDPFFVDLGGVFDLGDLPRQGGGPKDGLKLLNVSVIAIEVDIAALQKNGLAVSSATSILDPNFVIGVWASASRKQLRTLSNNGTLTYTGPWVQVSRLGMPLTNEAVIPIGKKDLWNSITPYQDLAYLDTFKNFFYNPELALYMDNSLFGGAVPAFAPLRIQRNSLQAFDFGNGHNGLFALKGSPAVAGTALDDAIFGTLLLPAANSPRSVDLWPIFHTGVPNLAPYHLATGKAGNPLANGKPFIHNFLPNGGDMLRLNMAVPVTQRNDPAFSADGLVNAAVLGLTNPTYNGSTALQFIPNMDGFPNGRRLEDDVTKIELQAVGGVVLAAIGLWYDDYTAGSPNPVTTDLLDVLTYTTGINNNDTSFRSTFPFVQMPWRGTGEAGGLAKSFTQAACLPVNVTSNLNLTCYIQGYWDGMSMMRPVLANQMRPTTAGACDTIKVELHNANTPFEKLYEVNAVLNQNGNVVCKFPPVQGMYYVVVKHRNALQTWSSAPVMMGPSTTYNFSNAASKAFASNQKMIAPNLWALYSGDIDANENIDLLDLTTLENDVTNWMVGYQITDLNGDGNVDLLDWPVLDGNVQDFIYARHP